MRTVGDGLVAQPGSKLRVDQLADPGEIRLVLELAGQLGEDLLGIVLFAQLPERPGLENEQERIRLAAGLLARATSSKASV